MTKTRISVPVSFHLPVDIETGEAGLVYATSPMVKGFFIAVHGRDEAISGVTEVLGNLANAYMNEGEIP